MKFIFSGLTKLLSYARNLIVGILQGANGPLQEITKLLDQILDSSINLLVSVANAGIRVLLFMLLYQVVFGDLLDTVLASL